MYDKEPVSVYKPQEAGSFDANNSELSINQLNVENISSPKIKMSQEIRKNKFPELNTGTQLFLNTQPANSTRRSGSHYVLENVSVFY